MSRSIYLPFLLFLLLLSGCKSELYSKLSESEANQMLALLIYNHIPADKSVGKEGVTLLVDKDRFVDAVEILRQNGLPRSNTLTIQDIFPSGQLVSSPEQDQAKLNYLRSQQLKKMLSSMDGVITAEVSIAENRSADTDTPAQISASVFIKYSPTVNLQIREAQIRELIRNAIPGLSPERISLVLQQAEYRYQSMSLSTTPVKMTIAGHPLTSRILLICIGTILLGVMMSLLFFWYRYRDSQR